MRLEVEPLVQVRVREEQVALVEGAERLALVQLEWG